MSYLPCKNPNCKSYGKPHPNCRCYAEMAEGGDARFCSSSRRHEPGCKYFAEGGDSFDPDAYLAAKGGFDPDAYLAGQNAPAQSDAFDPDAYLAEKNEEQYGSTGQQVLTGIEGAAQGLLGPAATAGELGLSKLGIPGISAEDIEGRQEANPWTHRLTETGAMAGSMLLGTGEAAVAAKLAGIAVKTTKVAEMGKLGALGASALKGAIGNGLIQLGDNASSWMLGQGDPQDPVGAATAHLGASMLFGGAFGVLGGKARGAVAQAAEGLEDLRLGDKLPSVLVGIGAKANPAEAEALKSMLKGAKSYPDPMLDKEFLKIGENVYDYVLKSASVGVTGAAAAAASSHIGYTGASALAAVIKPLVEKGFTKVGAKVAAPTILKILNSGKFQGFSTALNYADGVAKGAKLVDTGIERLFGAGGMAAEKAVNEYGSAEARDKLRDKIAAGGINQDLQENIYEQNQDTAPPEYAEGGEVKPAPITHAPNGVAIHYPEQNIMLNAAKGRISNYLNSLRPLPNAPKLAFDKEPDTKRQEKSYNKALDIANAPLGILEEIKNGTILPEHIKHLKAMYPELDNLLQKKITQRITKAQVDDKRPPYKIRQGLSLYMGAPLSSEFQPQNIQAAQAVFAQQAQQMGGQGSPPTKAKRSTAPLTKSDQAFLTSSQSRDGRQQRAR